MSEMSEISQMSQTKSRLFLLFLFLVCALPLALSYLTYYVWKPERRMNYGELLDMRKLPTTNLITLDGKPLSADVLGGKWVLLQIDRSSCDENCQHRLYAMRQSRLAMGVKKEKLETLWLIADQGPPADQLLQQTQGMKIAHAEAAYEASLPVPVQGRIFLLDPDGRLVLRYPENPDPARMIRDLARLLDVKKM